MGAADDETQATLLQKYDLVFSQTFIIRVTEQLQDTLLSLLDPSKFAQFCCLITSERPSTTTQGRSTLSLCSIKKEQSLNMIATKTGMSLQSLNDTVKDHA